MLRQLRGEDRLGRGAAVKSRASEELRARTVDADRVVKSVCPYCAVGCAQKVYVKDGRVGADRGRPGRAAQPRAAVPEGLGDAAADDGRFARAARALPPPVRQRVGAPRPGDGDGDGRREIRSRPQRRLGVGERGSPHAPLHEHRGARRRDARQRGELPDQEAPHGGSGSSRSRTRRASATARRSSAWARRSGAAPRARSRATCRTRT